MLSTCVGMAFGSQPFDRLLNVAMHQLACSSKRGLRFRATRRIVPQMTAEPHKHRDRYDVTGNVEAEYVDAKQTVLVNKLGITDLRELQVHEEEILVHAYDTLLDEIRTDTPMTAELIRYVHHRIFGQLYQWAGRWRTVNISKPGVTWPPPAYLDENMALLEKDSLAKYPANALTEDEAFCEAVAQIQGEFLVIHPFREGNARTIKLLTDLLAAQTGRPPLRYDQSDLGRDQYILAASQAFKRNYQPMIEIIRQALATAKRGP
jgi:cell filamentation protein